MWKANLPDPSLNINIFLEEGKELALHLLIPAYKRMYTNLTYKLKSGLAHAAC